MQGQFEVLVVGRANNRSQADIELPASEDTVGRRHAEITVGSNGDCYVVDLESSNGTFVADNGNWKRIQQSALNLDTPLRLGTFETTISALLRLRRPATPPPLPADYVAGAVPAPGKLNRRPRRNPTTGEVE